MGFAAAVDLGCQDNEDFEQWFSLAGVVDLTGYDLEFRMGKPDGGPVLSAPLMGDPTFTGITLNGGKTQFRLFLRGGDIAALAAADSSPVQPHNLIVTRPDGVRQIYMRGNFTVSQGI